jgi:hypothetical protein
MLIQEIEKNETRIAIKPKSISFGIITFRKEFEVSFNDIVC